MTDGQENVCGQQTAHVQALHASALISKGVLRKRIMSPEKSEKGIAKVQTFH